MSDPGPETAPRPPSLKAALRAARFDEVERAQAMGDLRGAEVARLSLLGEALQPVLQQVPPEVDMFDAGLVAGGERPRLFVDMIAFVEMARDRRSYRFLQDTRHGRVQLAETESLPAVTEAITHYIARRLVEREKVLASLLTDGTIEHRAESETPPAMRSVAPQVAARPGPKRGRGLVRALRLGIDGLGVLTLAGLFWLGMQYVQGRIAPW